MSSHSLVYSKVHYRDVLTEEMKLAAALAIANLIPDSELSDTNILPEAFDPKVTDVVAKAVMDLIK